MRILFDHNVPAPLGRFLEGHTVTTAKEQGWDRLVNGDLLNAAELGGFEVLITGDKGIRYQQNIAGRRIADRIGSMRSGFQRVLKSRSSPEELTSAAKAA